MGRRHLNMEMIRNFALGLTNLRHATHLSALYFEFHVILAGRLAVLALLPAVAVSPVAHLLPRVEQHRSALGPGMQTNNCPLNASDDGYHFGQVY